MRPALIVKGAQTSVWALKKRKVRDTSITNKHSIIKQLTHASFGKNFLQGVIYTEIRLPFYMLPNEGV